MNNIILSSMAWASSLRDAIVGHLKDEGGQDIMEYAVVVGAIALTVALVLGLGWGSYLQGAIYNFGDKIGGCLSFDSTTCNI